MAKLEIGSGKWWRFTDYVIQGNYIRPAKNAKLETYDPWILYNQSRDQRELVDSPYSSLLKLSKKLSIELELTTGESPTVAQEHLPPESQEILLDWCRQYGLLGILPASCVQVDLAPVWTMDHAPQAKRGPTAQYKRYVRAEGAWKELTIFLHLSRSGSVKAGKPLDPKIYKPFNLPNVSNFSMLDFDLDNSELSTTWGKFFPDLTKERRSDYQYPCPNTKDFWHEYAEPVVDFIAEASVFADELGTMQNQEDTAYLNWLASAVVPTLVNTDGEFRLEWKGSTLLNSFALMAAMDITIGRSLRNCKRCELPFLTGSEKGLYCSSTCRKSAQIQRYRVRIREKKQQMAKTAKKATKGKKK